MVLDKMTNAYPMDSLDTDGTPGLSLSLPDAGSSRRTNGLSNKLTSVLSYSYADPETRHALNLIDGRGLRNVEETRRGLKYDAQKEVVDSNVAILHDFTRVAEVCTFFTDRRSEF